ncbi:hypothetical protein FisN_20Lh140 [Fistulifera solaris]|uniref:Uncharacterized protein n=1 Tax=Fistulifera solaris TaxID=1519565 RepID=A0A1Z5KR95_FISSO|nr:hypothetical protein FisN_20Lh140 [Fistulifera solaris]|eukprot:GAX28844.1 hypothetical protein FisN_20Lh140 [Fistulifera solaris]
MVASRKVQATDGAQWFPLTKMEDAIYGNHRPAGLESRFETTQLSATLQYLQRRATEIAKANSWVHGRLRLQPKDRKLAVWVPDTAEVFLQVIQVDSLDDITRIASEANCGTGKQCLEHQLPIVKLRVFLSHRAPSQLLLTLSVCHQVSDATALYALWGMLDPYATVEALDMKRQSRDFWLTSASGLPSQAKFVYSLLCTDSSPLRKKRKIDQRKLTPLFHTIRRDWIQEQKLAHKKTKDAPFVSTQDVFTSWYMRTFQPACGSLVVNLRHRHNKALTNKHVGNYLDLLVMNPADYASPSQIRKIVASSGAASTWNMPGPGSLQGTVSCWHSLYKDVQLPHSERLTHLPLRGGMFCLSSAPNSRMAVTLFRTSSTDVAIMGFAPQMKDIEIDNMEPLGQELVR